MLKFLRDEIAAISHSRLPDPLGERGFILDISTSSQILDLRDSVLFKSYSPFTFLWVWLQKAYFPCKINI